VDNSYYLDKFQHTQKGLNKAPFVAVGLDLKAGIWLNCPVLKLQKPAWNNPGTKPFEGGIFCSIWLSDETISKSRLCYNIHALKLRELKAYKLQSREFATEFRSRFAKLKGEWPNVSTQFGPLTLMEGWVEFNEDTLEKDIAELAVKFLPVAEVIDGLLNEKSK